MAYPAVSPALHIETQGSPACTVYVSPIQTGGVYACACSYRRAPGAATTIAGFVKSVTAWADVRRREGELASFTNYNDARTGAHPNQLSTGPFPLNRNRRRWSAASSAAAAVRGRVFPCRCRRLTDWLHIAVFLTEVGINDPLTRG